MNKTIISLIIIILIVIITFCCLKENKEYYIVKDYIEEYGWNVKDIEISKSIDIFSTNSQNVFEKSIIDLSKEIGIDVNEYSGEVVYHVGVLLNDEINIDINDELHKVPLEATLWITENNEIAFAVLRVAFMQTYYYPLDISIDEVETLVNDMY